MTLKERVRDHFTIKPHETQRIMNALGPALVVIIGFYIKEEIQDYLRKHPIKF